MPKVVNVPGVGEFSLDDSWTDAQAQQFVAKVSAAGSLDAAIAEAQKPGQGGIPVVSPLIKGALSGVAEIPISVYGLGDKAGAQKARESVSYGLSSLLGMDPTKQPTTLESLAEAGGSIAPLLGATVLSEGAAAPLLAARLGLGGARALTAAEEAAALGKLASGVQKARLAGGAAAAVPLGMGQAQQMASAYEQRTGQELTPGQYAAANIAGGAVGLFDLAPLERWAEPIAKLLQKVPASEALAASKIVNNAKSRFLGKVAAGAAMEGGQEAVSQIAQNLVAAGIYDPEQSITDSVAENFGLGAGVGGIIETALLGAAGIKRRRNLAKANQFETDVVNKFNEARGGIANQQFAETADTIANLSPDQPIIADRPEDLVSDIRAVNRDLTKARADLAFFDSTGGATGGKVKPTAPVPLDTLSSSELTNLGARLGVKPKQGETLVDAIGAIKNQNRVTRELIAQRVDVLQNRLNNSQRKLDLLQSQGTSADKGLVVNRKFEVRNAPSATHTMSDVASAAVNGTAIEDVRAPLDAIRALKPLLKQKNIAGPRPDTSNLTEEELNSIIKKAGIKLEPSETARDAVEAMPDNSLKKALISRELDALRQNAGQQKMFAVVENQYDAQGNKIGEAIVRRHADKNAADNNVKALNEAADPLAYQARMAPIAKRLRNVMSGMGMSDVGIKFEQFLTDRSTYEEGVYDPRQRLITFATSIYEPGMSDAQIEAKITSVLNHEVIHALKDVGVFTDAEWNTLVRAAETRKMDGKLYTPLEWVAGIRSDLAESAKAGDARAAETLQEEAVAEMFRNWVANGKKPAPASGLLSRIMNFFKRMIGFAKANKVEGIFADIASGKIGGRQRAPFTPPPISTPTQAAPEVSPQTAPEAAPEAAEPRLGATGTMYRPVTMEAPERPAEMQGPEDQYPVYESEMYQPVTGIRRMRPYRGEDARAAYEDIRLSSKVNLSGEESSANTQRENTIPSYQRSAELISRELPNAKTILDYGAGFGLGADAMREINSANIEAFEPFPKNWKGSKKVDYTDANKIKKKYDAVVNLNVLNVLKKDLRDETVRKIASLLNPGGIAIIGARAYNGDIATAKTNIPQDEPKAVLTLQKGEWNYQKGWDGNELLEYVRSLVPDGYAVEKIPAKEGITKTAVKITAPTNQKFSKVEVPKAAQARIDDNGKLIINPYPEGNIGTSTRYIREGETLVRKKGQKVGIEDIARAFDEITPQRDILDPAQRNEIINSIVDEVNLQKEQEVSGIGWYDSDVSATFGILSEALPILRDPYAGEMHRRMFTIVAGVMSNGMKAKDNVHLGGLNFAHFMNTGEFSAINPLTGKGYNQRTNIMSRQIDMLNKIYKDPMFAPRPGSNDPQMERMENFIEWMFTPHSVREINALRARGGIPSPAKIGAVDDQRLGMYAFGPKFGPFILNLNGLSDETVDSWASRSFYRHMGQAITNGKMNDGPRSPAEREAMKASLRDIANLTGLTSRDVQAVLWFYEKELYNKLGKNIPLEVFSDGARQFVREYNNAKQNVGTGQAGGRTFAGTVGAARTRARPGAQRAIAIQVRKPDPTIAEIADKYIKKQSAVALPQDLQTAYDNAFTEPVQRTFFEKMTDYFTGNAGLRFIQSTFNQDQIIEYTEKGFYGKRLDAAMSATAAITMARRSSFVSAAAMFNGIAPVQFKNKGDISSAYVRAANPDEDVDAIAKFMAPIIRGGLTKQFALYGLAKRAKSLPGKKVARLTDVEVDNAIKLGDQHPEVKEAFEAYQRHNKNLINMAVQTGRIAQSEADAMLNDLNYYGAYRVYEGELASPTTGGNVGGGSTIHKLSGQSDEKVLADPIEMMIRNQNFWVNAAMKNLAALKAGKLAVTAGEAHIVKGTPPAGSYTMTAYEDGKKVVYQFTGPRADLWYKSLRSNDRIDFGVVGKLLGFPANALRFSVTHDPGFILANLFRDSLSTWVLRGEQNQPWETFTNFAESLKGSSSLEAMRSFGVGGGYDAAMKDPETQSKMVKGQLEKGVHTITDPMRLLGGLMQRVEAWSEASDAATRLAVFKKVMEETGDEYEAAYRALEVMNFSKHGSSAIVQGLSQIIPFFNAGLQGKLVLGKSISALGKGISRGGFDTLTDEERRLGKGMLYRGTTLAAVALMLEMLCAGDDEYEDRVPDYMRETNFIIPLKYFGMSGTFIKIPKPFEAGAIFATVPTAFYRWGNNENVSGKDVVRTMTAQFSTNMGMNIMPQLVAPVVEHYFNVDLYSGQPLIGRGKESLDPSLQYNASTGEISKFLGGFKVAYDTEKGEFTGIPPVIIQNYIQSWGGPLGSYLLMAADGVASGGGITTTSAATPVMKYPVIRRFLMDAKDQNPVGADNLYKMIGKLDEVNRTIAYYRKIGDAEGLKEYLEEKKPILRVAPAIKALSGAARDIRNMDTAVNEDRKMTAQQKLDEQRRINDLEAKFLDDIRKLKRELDL